MLLGNQLNVVMLAITSPKKKNDTYNLLIKSDGPPIQVFSRNENGEHSLQQTNKHNGSVGINSSSEERKLSRVEFVLNSTPLCQASVFLYNQNPIILIEFTVLGAPGNYLVVQRHTLENHYKHLKKKKTDPAQIHGFFDCKPEDSLSPEMEYIQGRTVANIVEDLERSYCRNYLVI